MQRCARHGKVLERQHRKKWNAGELKDTEIELFELDIKSMFPSLSREGV